MGEKWLNITSRLILAKAVLSTLPVCQYSSLLALMSVKREIAQQIRKFLWEDGK
jgi:hypothetical protein